MKIRTKTVFGVLVASFGLMSAACTGNSKVRPEAMVEAEDSIISEPTAIDIDVDREELLRKRILEIYSIDDIGGREDRYCSTAYLEVYKAVLAADAETGEIGFFDYDHWTSAQDCPDAPVFMIKRIDRLSDTEAIVEVREDEMNTGARLKCVWERGNWYIDDFLSSDSVSELQQMQLHLEQP